MLLNTMNLHKTILFCYIQVQSCTCSNQALQPYLHDGELLEEQCEVFSGHRKMTTNLNP